MCAVVTGVQTCALPIDDVPVCGSTLGDITQRRQSGLIEPRKRGRDVKIAQHQQRLRRRHAEMVVYIMRQSRFARSEEHTSELQSLMRISYAVFCLKKKTYTHRINIYIMPIVNTSTII